MRLPAQRPKRSVPRPGARPQPSAKRSNACAVRSRKTSGIARSSFGIVERTSERTGTAGGTCGKPWFPQNRPAWWTPQGRRRAKRLPAARPDAHFRPGTRIARVRGSRARAGGIEKFNGIAAKGRSYVRFSWAGPAPTFGSRGQGLLLRGPVLRQACQTGLALPPSLRCAP